MRRDDPRIVLVSGGIGLGGATTFLLNLAGELVQRRIPVLVISLEHENPYASDFASREIPLHVEDERTSIFEDRLNSALRVIRAFQPTSIVACLGPSSFEILRYAPRGVTRLGMIQSDFPENYPPFCCYLPFLDGMIAVSSEILRNLRLHPELSSVPSYYLPYGIAIPPKKVRMSREEAPIRILYLGRLCDPQKRVKVFPEILNRLKLSEIPFQWTIAGDGPERAWLERKMVSVIPSIKVTFLGAVRYQDVPPILESHDIFLLASDAEGLPLSLLEAMSYGLVPVVSDLPSGTSEVVNSQCGILVRPDKIDEYAAGIISLARDRTKLAAMAEHAQKRVSDEYSSSAMADCWLALLKNLSQKIPAKWPRQFRISGVLTDPLQWKYLPPLRWLRRLLKSMKNS